MNPAERLCRFEADGFELRIAGQPERTLEVRALEGALLLERVSALLQCVDFWLNTSLDWQPASQDAEMNLAPCAATVILRAQRPQIDSAMDIGLVFNSERLGTIPPWPTALDEFVVPHWAQRPVRVSLGDVSLGAGDLHRAGPGSLLVLPSSFDPVMQASLGCADTGERLGQVLIDWRLGEMFLATTTASAHVPTTSCTAATASASAPGNEGCVAIALAAPLQLPVNIRFDGPRRDDAWRHALSLVGLPVALSLRDACWHGDVVRLGDGLGVVMSEAPAWT